MILTRTSLAIRPIAVAFVVLMWLLASVSTAEAIDISSRLELFVDRYLVDSLDGARLVLHPPTNAETVLAFDRPWERHYSGYVTVIQDGPRYRLYYRGLPAARADGSDAEVTCVAESGDGIHFIKPNVGLYDFGGSRSNNIVLAGMAPFSHNFAPFLDTRPGVPADERYKALAGTQQTGLVAFASEDGLSWRRLRDEPVITDGAFDSQNVAFWSEHEQQYVSYFRIFVNDIRSIARATSSDFLAWSPRADMQYGDTPREHLYTNQTRPYFRAPHLYVATAARFVPGRRVVTDEEMARLGGIGQYAGDCSDAVLLTTRGGNAYDRTYMDAFIRPGLGLNNWTSRTNYPAHGIVQTGPTEMSIYVQRNYGQDDHHLQRVVMRLDGLASVNASYGGGTMITKLLTFSGKRLVLNFGTSAAGGIRVELQDDSGTPLPGYTANDCDEMVGDRVEYTVTWKGDSDVGELASKPVRLKFMLKDADVFSMQFTND